MLWLDLEGDTDSILKSLYSKEALLSGEEGAATLHKCPLSNKLKIEKNASSSYITYYIFM